MTVASKRIPTPLRENIARNGLRHKMANRIKCRDDDDDGALGDGAVVGLAGSCWENKFPYL